MLGFFAYCRGGCNGVFYCQRKICQQGQGQSCGHHHRRSFVGFGLVYDCAQQRRQNQRCLFVAISQGAWHLRGLHCCFCSGVDCGAFHNQSARLRVQEIVAFRGVHVDSSTGVGNANVVDCRGGRGVFPCFGGGSASALRTICLLSSSTSKPTTSLMSIGLGK